MGVQTYSAQQRRAVNLIWAAAGEYGFEPKFLAMKTDGTPDFYMNFVIGLVYKWFGLDMLERLFDSWLGDVRQAVMDDLAWLALESTVYQKELPGRPALEELRQELHQTNQALRNAYDKFNFVTAPELVEASIYEINALKARSDYLLRCIKAQLGQEPCAAAAAMKGGTACPS